MSSYESRKIEDLIPQTQEKVKKLIQLAAEANLPKFVFTSTYRSFARQAELYSQGRTTPGAKVTNAMPGRSFHNVRRAVDVAFLTPEGTLDWKTDAYAKLGALAWQAGLAWGGSWHNPDRPHFEDHYCETCKQDVTAHDALHFNEKGECKKKV